MRVLVRLWWRIRNRNVSGEPVSDMDRARALIDALDRGGVPSDPVRINAIARSLGLEVSRRAPIAETVLRIRAAVGRASNSQL